MNVLILGASGMLGSTMYRVLSAQDNYEVFATLHGSRFGATDTEANARLITEFDANNHDCLLRAFTISRPQVVVNCVGLVKQIETGNAPLTAIPINALLPHRLASICEMVGSRLVHFSTDCVFSGASGFYSEADVPDPSDIYGRTKLLGEVNRPHAITLRTSIIGRELSGARSLLCWFLAQAGPVKGYRKAIFSGLPTNELARIVRDYVLPLSDLHGLYHVAAAPIDKCSLLQLVARTYGKTTEIIPDDTLVIDRSLCAERFRLATGYIAPPWPELVGAMYEFN